MARGAGRLSRGSSGARWPPSKPALFTHIEATKDSSRSKYRSNEGQSVTVGGTVKYRSNEAGQFTQ
jgi:hypothetical protein